MKRSVIFTVIISVILCGCNVSVNTFEAKPENKTVLNMKDAVLTEAEYPFYLFSPDNEGTIKLFFADENKEIPYIGIDTAKDILESVYHEANRDEGFKITVSQNGNITTLTRENKHTMSIDSDNDVISFDDFDSFFAPSWSNTVIDTLEHYGIIEYMRIVKERSYSLCGSPVDLDLGKYGIDIIENDGKCYIPMQTFSDVALSLHCYISLLYNGEAVFGGDFAFDEKNNFDPKIYSAKTGNRSSELADFTYNELCFVMDHFYGLKEQQGDIEDFDKYLSETGQKQNLLSEDPAVFTNSLADFLLLYLDDLHSYYMKSSYLAGKDFSLTTSRTGNSYQNYMLTYKRLLAARDAQFPEGVPGYEEIDNTAYITFDQFDSLEEGADYYKDPPKADTKDTVGLLLYSYDQIKRKDSPIENVVFDLSLNGGGDQTTTCFMLSMILGRSSMTVEDDLTGGFVCEYFEADLNLDRKFDEKDSLSDYNLYCIISPSTFSCANLAASELKNTHTTTLLGQTSGGGTCIVMPFTLADGTLILISGCRVLSSIKNGSLYNIDRGIEPDIYIAKPSSFYDRKALTDYINTDLQ
ncbi:MAG: hypothetical protein K6E49_01000 [Lachnospiraceae bacterium]|nr:hypothetical protein [Lachnospiraceae bacterium]